MSVNINTGANITKLTPAVVTALKAGDIEIDVEFSSDEDLEAMLNAGVTKAKDVNEGWIDLETDL